LVRNCPLPRIKNYLEVGDGAIEVPDDARHHVKELGPMTDESPFFDGVDCPKITESSWGPAATAA
jgi:hypothetical protein